MSDARPPPGSGGGGAGRGRRTTPHATEPGPLRFGMAAASPTGTPPAAGVGTPRRQLQLPTLGAIVDESLAGLSERDGTVARGGGGRDGRPSRAAAAASRTASAPRGVEDADIDDGEPPGVEQLRAALLSSTATYDVGGGTGSMPASPERSSDDGGGGGGGSLGVVRTLIDAAATRTAPPPPPSDAACVDAIAARMMEAVAGASPEDAASSAVGGSGRGGGEGGATAAAAGGGGSSSGLFGSVLSGIGGRFFSTSAGAGASGGATAAAGASLPASARSGGSGGRDTPPTSQSGSGRSGNRGAASSSSSVYSPVSAASADGGGGGGVAGTLTGAQKTVMGGRAAAAGAAPHTTVLGAGGDEAFAAQLLGRVTGGGTGRRTAGAAPGKGSDINWGGFEFEVGELDLPGAAGPGSSAASAAGDGDGDEEEGEAGDSGGDDASDGGGTCDGDSKRPYTDDENNEEDAVDAVGGPREPALDHRVFDSTGLRRGGSGGAVAGGARLSSARLRGHTPRAARAGGGSGGRGATGGGRSAAAVSGPADVVLLLTGSDDGGCDSDASGGATGAVREGHGRVLPPPPPPPPPAASPAPSPKAATPAAASCGAGGRKGGGASAEFAGMKGLQGAFGGAPGTAGGGKGAPPPPPPAPAAAASTAAPPSPSPVRPPPSPPSSSASAAASINRSDLGLTPRYDAFRRALIHQRGTGVAVKTGGGGGGGGDVWSYGGDVLLHGALYAPYLRWFADAYAALATDPDSVDGFHRFLGQFCVDARDVAAQIAQATNDQRAVARSAARRADGDPSNVRALAGVYSQLRSGAGSASRALPPSPLPLLPASGGGRRVELPPDLGLRFVAAALYELPPELRVGDAHAVWSDATVALRGDAAASHELAHLFHQFLEQACHELDDASNSAALQRLGGQRVVDRLLCLLTFGMSDRPVRAHTAAFGRRGSSISGGSGGGGSGDGGATRARRASLPPHAAAAAAGGGGSAVDDDDEEMFGRYDAVEDAAPLGDAPAYRRGGGSGGGTVGDESGGGGGGSGSGSHPLLSAVNRLLGELVGAPAGVDAEDGDLPLLPPEPASDRLRRTLAVIEARAVDIGTPAARSAAAKAEEDAVAAMAAAGLTHDDAVQRMLKTLTRDVEPARQALSGSGGGMPSARATHRVFSAALLAVDMLEKTQSALRQSREHYNKAAGLANAFQQQMAPARTACALVLAAVTDVCTGSGSIPAAAAAGSRAVDALEARIAARLTAAADRVSAREVALHLELADALTGLREMRNNTPADKVADAERQADAAKAAAATSAAAAEGSAAEAAKARARVGELEAELAALHAFWLAKQEELDAAAAAGCGGGGGKMGGAGGKKGGKGGKGGGGKGAAGGDADPAAQLAAAHEEAAHAKQRAEAAAAASEALEERLTKSQARVDELTAQVVTLTEAVNSRVSASGSSWGERRAAPSDDDDGGGGGGGDGGGSGGGGGRSGR
jgi:hypothetical protein